MNTKLIIVEGLPGSGKSTTAETIQKMCEEKGIPNRLFQEGNVYHPADFESVAYLPLHELEDLLSPHAEIREVLFEISTSDNEYVFVPYRQLYEKIKERLPEALYHALAKYDIYELPFDLHTTLVKRRWEQFAQQAMNENVVYIFECCFIQNPVTIGMMKYNETKEKVFDYIESLQHAILPLEPVIVYVQKDNIKQSFFQAVDERSEAWSNGFISYYTEQGYGKSIGASGATGAVDVLKARASFEKEILDQLQIPVVSVHTSKTTAEEMPAILEQRLEVFSKK